LTLCGENRPSAAKAELVSQGYVRAKQAAEKGRIRDGIKKKNVPQGLKPTHFIGFIGTTEVMP